MDKILYRERTYKGIRAKISEDQFKQYEKDWNDDFWLKFCDYLKDLTPEQSFQEYVIRGYRCKIETDTALRKRERYLNSQKYKRILSNWHTKRLKSIDNAEIDKARLIRSTIRGLEEVLTKEITEQYKKEGRNINNHRTKASIQNKVTKKIIAETGIHPDNVRNKSLKQLRQIIFTEFDKPLRPSLAELDKSDIFAKKYEDLSPIEKNAIDDPVKYVSTMLRLQQFKEAQRNGRLGMYQDSNGEFQA